MKNTIIFDNKIDFKQGETLTFFLNENLDFKVEGKTFRFTVLDMRGLTVEIPAVDVGNGFNAADVDKRNYVGTALTLNATALQISRDVTRTVNVELEAGGAAPATVAVTVKQNSDASLAATTS